MKRFTMIALFMCLLFMTSCFTTDTGMSIGRAIFSSHLSDYMKAKDNAYWTEITEEKIKHWEKAIPSYDDGSSPLTLGNIYQELGKLYLKDARIGEVPDITRKIEEQVAKIDAIGLDNLEDDGIGLTKNWYREKGTLPPSVIRHQKNFYEKLKTTPSSLMASYYTAIGDKKKAAKYRKKNQDATGMTAQMEKVKEEGQQTTYKKPALDDHSRALVALWYEYLTDGENLDERMKQFVDAPSGMDTIGQNGPVHFVKQAEIIEKYGIMASVYYQLGFFEKAYAHYKKGFELFQAIELPEEYGDFANTMTLTFTNDPFTWNILHAMILCELDDPKSIEIWDQIVLDLERRENDDSMNAQLREVRITDGMRDMILAESFKAYRKFGRTEAGFEFVETNLEERESARSSLAAESDKRNYLAGGLDMYGTYISLTKDAPGDNLGGMERAKSRAMLDLMAGGLNRIDNQDLRDVTMMQAALGPATSGKTGGSKQRALDKKLTSLKRNHPEYYTLVTTDIESPRKLASMLSKDEVALSYYVTDDAVLINVVSSKGNSVFNMFGKQVGQVVTVPISRTTLMEAVHHFRKELTEEGRQEEIKGGEVTIDYDAKTGDIIVTNMTSLPLTVLGITNDYRMLTYSSIGASVPLPGQHEIKGHSMLIKGEVKTDSIASGKRAVVSTQPQGGERPYAQRGDEDGYDYGRRTLVTVHTNLGALDIEIASIAPAGKPITSKVRKTRNILIPTSNKSLYDILIKPVEEQIAGKHLVIVPHGLLHSIPFEALKDDQGRYLIEKHVVSYTPSLNVLKLVRDKKRPKPTSLVAFGDTLGDLQFARSEVADIKTEFSQSTVLLGEQVTQSSVRSNIGRGDVVHFATHGVFDAESPLDSGLVLSSGGGTSASRENNANTQSPELLKVTDIMGLKMNPDLVFLSACDTARAEISSGDEIVGLTRGFFVAGSPSVINTLWAIDDQSTAMLAKRFYQNMFDRGMDKATSLQEAKLHLMKNGFKEPYYWGAFVLQGDWQ